MDKLIVLMIRIKLSVKNKQRFYFKNQLNTQDRYFFSKDQLMKETFVCGKPYYERSNINLKFILSDEIKDLIVRA